MFYSSEPIEIPQRIFLIFLAQFTSLERISRTLPVDKRNGISANIQIPTFSSIHTGITSIILTSPLPRHDCDPLLSGCSMSIQLENSLAILRHMTMDYGSMGDKTKKTT